MDKPEGSSAKKELAELRACDIMIPLDKYPHLPYWFTLKQAIVEMERSTLEVDGRVSLPRMVLIFDERYQLMGMARRRDILRGLEPEFLRGRPMQHRKKLWDVQVDPNLSELSVEKVMDDVIRLAERPISEVMISVDGTVNCEDHIVRVVYEMNKCNLSMLPVLRDGQVVGVVRSVDVFHRFARLIVGAM